MREMESVTFHIFIQKVKVEEAHPDSLSFI